LSHSATGGAVQAQEIVVGHVRLANPDLSGRIGERLNAASTQATAQVADELAGDSRVLSVLATRSRAADELVDRLFPAMSHRSLSVYNAAGSSAGRAAADLALFDVHAPMAG
jgi:small ligand-binding sensory domain FIST